VESTAPRTSKTIRQTVPADEKNLKINGNMTYVKAQYNDGNMAVI
jgi:hypothetical protein